MRPAQLRASAASSLLTAPRPLGRGVCAHWGLSHHLSGPPRARHHRLRPRRQPRGGAGSSPAKLARAQLRSKVEAKAYKRSYPPRPKGRRVPPSVRGYICHLGGSREDQSSPHLAKRHPLDGRQNLISFSIHPCLKRRGFQL